jgi:ribose transport system ATP-binding protein
MGEETVLRATGISKRFPGTKALSGVSFDIRKGEIVALVGENGAGKSTFVNIVGGVLQPDEGTLEVFGKTVTQFSPRDARDAGIGFVHQELSNCLHLTVAENIFIGRLDQFRTRLGLIDYARLNRETASHLRIFDSKIRPEQRMRELKIADQQVVEITKSMSINCRLLIFDEPTSSLNEAEALKLFTMIRELKARGISIIYISHRMEEVFSLSDRITVFRDGCSVATFATRETTPAEIVTRMVGRVVSTLYPPKSEKVGSTILEVKNMTCKGMFEDISFELRRGEILGFAGLVGAGRSELACGLCGLYRLDSGEISLEGRALKIGSFAEAIRNGICYMTEDRKLNGLFLRMKLKQNITSTKLSNVTSGLLIRNELETRAAVEMVKKLNIRTGTVEQSVNSLSGGNQQRVMIAKWLYTDPRILILDEPTRGVDVGAKSEIHTMLRALCNEGRGIIVISSELPELIGICDRAVVMHEGRKVGELAGSDLTEAKVMAMATAI